MPTTNKKAFTSARALGSGSSVPTKRVDVEQLGVDGQVAAVYRRIVTAKEQRSGASAPQSMRQAPSSESRYVLGDQIASGGMASVHVALQLGAEGFHRVVALKRIHPHLAQQREFCEMFIDEARIAARINHPNVCRILDFGQGTDGYFLAMEYLAGEPMSKVIRAVAKRPDLRSSPRYPLLIARIFANLAEGLHAAHTLTTERGEHLQVVHRDVTPQNLFFLYDGTVRVTDFGIAVARQRVHQTQGNPLKGKLSYMAPEQLERRPLDRRADIWSLGVALWESLALERLFRGESEADTVMRVMGHEILPPSLKNPQVTPALDAVLERALTRDPDRRYQSARELARDLERCLGWSSDTVPTMDLSDWMRELNPQGAEQAASFVRAALLLSTRPPPGDEETVRLGLPAPSGARPLDIAPVEAGDLAQGDEGITAPYAPPPASPPHERPVAASRGRRNGLLSAGAGLAVLLVGFGVTRQRLTESATRTTVGVASSAAASLRTDGPKGPVAPSEPTASLPKVADPSPEPPPAAPAPPSVAVEAETSKVAVETAPPATRRPATPAPVKAPPSAVAVASTQVGSILVNASSGAGEIYENGRLLGRTPVTLTLPAGRHTLTARSVSGGSDRPFVVNVGPGGFGVVSLGFAPPAPAAPAAKR
jgi:eukaryotic-like serine/threonine-protein kinase